MWQRPRCGRRGGTHLSPRKTLSELSEGFTSSRRTGILMGMKVTLTLLGHLCRCLGVLLQLLRYSLSFCWALLLPRAVTAAQLLAFQSQLAVELNRSSAPRKRHHEFSPAFRILWVVLSKCLDGWEELVHVMKPETVKRWHTRAFRAWWRWKSKSGRKPVALELQRLIRRLSKENPLWGAARIRDVLLLMGYEAPGEDTVRKYMVKPRKPRSPSTSWLPFLPNHVDCSWAIDFFTVTTLRFQVLYVFLVFDHARRKVLHFAITPNPTMEWVIQQLREAIPFGEQPRYLFRDNDDIYGRGVPQDKAGRANARRTWEGGELPGELSAELLARLIHFAPDHAWNQEKLRRVGSGCGLTPDDLLQVLREKQTDAGSSPQA